MTRPTHAMVFAAGRGERLRPLTERTPKPLLPVGGRPMIDIPLRFLAAAGVTDVVINVHHLGERIEEALGELRFGLRLRYSREPKLLDTGGGLAKARPWLDWRGSFWIVNADTMIDADPDAILAFHRKNRPMATLVVRADPDVDRYGALELDEQGRLRRLVGEPADAKPGPVRRMFTGLQLVEPNLFDYLPRRRNSLTRVGYVRALAAGEAIYGFEHDGYWRDCGTPESLEAADRDVRERRFHPAWAPGAPPLV